MFRFPLDALVALVVASVAAVRWAYKWVKNIDLMNRFIYDLGTNHLPHIYMRLNQIDAKLDIARTEHPNIAFVDDEPKQE